MKLGIEWNAIKRININRLCLKKRKISSFFLNLWSNDLTGIIFGYSDVKLTILW
jgi:hypothetical protein